MDKLKILKLMADETRLKIIEVLSKGDKCACEIVPFTGKSQPNVSLHLKKMEEAGILSSRKDATKVIFKIKNKKVLKILQILK